MGLNHIISAYQFNKENLRKIFSESDKIKRGNFDGKALKGKIMATLFYEPSTRTRLSFESAMLRLGGNFISTENAAEFSSAIKGETLKDTIRIVNLYSDLIVLRHPDNGASELASKYSKVPIINAGDGNGEHPTQALLDLYTIESRVDREDFKIAICGDLRDYRSSHSLSILLSLYNKVNIVYISPRSLQIPQTLLKYLKDKNVDFSQTENFVEGIKEVDIIYQTRLPKEYMKSNEYEKNKGKFTIDKKILLSIGKKTLIMHPLPRVDEISQEIDSDFRAIYFEQARNGLYIRMALLLLLFDKA